jgi:UDP-glucose:(heptosyl)LPS alpha-1,3-glucosyltransferase
MKKVYLIRANNKIAGGAEMYLSELSKEFKLLKINHEIIHTNLPKFLPSWLRVLLFNWSTCFSKKNNFYFSLDRISCPDIYRTDDGVHKVFLSIENKSKTNPLHIVYLALEKKAFKKAKRIIAISNMVKEDIVRSYKIDPKKIVVIPNGIKLEKVNIKEAYKNIREEFNIGENKKIITFVGSGFKRKGVEEFLEIISRLKYENIQVFIVGREKNISYYKQLSTKLGLDKKVIFTGSRNDVKYFYAISDIFLFPTHYDPFGNVILEAMNFSNVVFTTKKCGASYILDSEFIMETPKSFLISKKIDDILNNPKRLEEIKMRNLKHVGNFTIEKNVEETLKVICEVIH